jgi:hypothetical protein
MLEDTDKSRKEEHERDLFLISGRQESRDLGARSKQDKQYLDHLQSRKRLNGGVLFLLLILLIVAIGAPFIIYAFVR